MTFSTICSTVLDGRRHRDGTHHMLAGVQCLERHPGVIVNRAVDVDIIHSLIRQDFFVCLITIFDPKLIAGFVQFGFVSSANRMHIGFGMALVDRDKFRTKAQPDHRDIEGIIHGLSFSVVDTKGVCEGTSRLLAGRFLEFD